MCNGQNVPLKQNVHYTSMHILQTITYKQSVHTQYIIASLLHWNIKVYIFITILERKDQVKKTTCSLSCSSFLFVIRKTERKKKRNNDLESKTWRPQWRVAIDSVHIKGKEANSRTCYITHTYTCTHMWGPFIVYIPQTLSLRLLLTCCQKSTTNMRSTWLSVWFLGVRCQRRNSFVSFLEMWVKLNKKKKD